MYVFNPLIILVLTETLLTETSSRFLILIIFLAAFSLNVFISYISYKYFETPFLKLKYKFSKIISGDEAQQVN